MQRFIITGTSIFLIWLILAPQVSADVIYVNDDAPGPVHNGNSWTEALTSLQDALDAAQAYDTIWVAKGTYKPETLFDPNEPRSASFCLINHVGVFGGFAGTENPASFDLDDRDFELNETILTGDLNDNGRDPNDSYHVFYHPQGTNLDPNAIIDGFTITGGNADDYYLHYDGAGIYNYQSSPVITNCKFIDNYTPRFNGHGGGIYNYESSTIITNCTFIGNTSDSGGGVSSEYGRPIIDNCYFYDNYASWCGGAMFNHWNEARITNCTFTENVAAYAGGGLSIWGNPYIADCRFEYNRVIGYSALPSERGGGIVNWGGDCTLVNCTFLGNCVDIGPDSGAYGGGMYHIGDFGSLTLLNCLFAGNWCKSKSNATSKGGGLFSAGYNTESTLINCVFTGNSATSTYAESYDRGLGGGIYNVSSDITLINCTLTGNWVGWLGNGSAMYSSYCNTTIKNCIIWWNYVYDYYDYDGVYIPKPWNSFMIYNYTPNISHSNIFGCGGSDYWVSYYGNDLGGNIDEVPNFIDVDGSDDIFGTEDDNVSLLPGSLCIDAGDNSALPLDVTVDILGSNRFFDDPNTTDTGSGTPPIVDMGACEYDGTLEQPQGVIIYVDDDAAGANDGTSWENAFNDLQDALDAASCGDDIWVAKGTYFPTEKIAPYNPDSAVFHLSNGVKLLGGFAGTENPDTFDIDKRDCEENETILSGESYIFNILYNDVSLALNRTAVLDGFTISGARRGAMLNEASSPTIKNCLFTNNWANSDGTAIYNYYNSSLITECTFTENSVYSSSTPGGIIYNESSSPLISNCLFSNNSFEYCGGSAIYNENESYYPYKPLTITNCAFINNQTPLGAICSSNVPNTKILGCLFNGNETHRGGGVSIQYGDAEIRNCTFSNNLADYGSAINPFHANFTMTNCILWDNVALKEESSQLDLYSSSIAIDYSDIEGAESAVILNGESTLDWGTGNIDLDPLFADDDNLRLLLGSPCIDAGDNLAVPVDLVTDIQGWDRFLDDPHAADTGAGTSPIVDMGAYERDHRDINSDGRFNLEDLAALSANWLSADCGPCNGANLNTDTEVNLVDLLILTETYLR